MATAARKARKRAGIKFEKAQKVGTPIRERAWFNQMFPGLAGTKTAGILQPRSAKKRERALADRGLV